MNTSLLFPLNKQQERLIHVIKENEHLFEKLFMYNIHYSFPLSETLISQNNLFLLKSLIRSLINGKRTIDGVNNRDWFSKYFSGGFYKINIHQRIPEDYPVIEYHLICFSKRNDLENVITNDLICRIKNILNETELKSFFGEPFSVHGINSLKEKFERINSTSGFHFFSQPVRSLTKSYLDFMFSTMHQPIRTFGIFYKKIHLAYLEDLPQTL